VSGKDALITLFSSFAVAGFLKYLEFGPLAGSQSLLAQIVVPFGNQGLITWAFAMIICSVSAAITAPPSPEQVGEGLVFSIKDKKILSAGLGTKWYNSVLLWWGLAFALMIAIILTFSVFVK
jgi:solute:Na+ symporter, SSS family